MAKKACHSPIPTREGKPSGWGCKVQSDLGVLFLCRLAGADLYLTSRTEGKGTVREPKNPLVNCTRLTQASLQDLSILARIGLERAKQKASRELSSSRLGPWVRPLESHDKPFHGVRARPGMWEAPSSAWFPDFSW